jgi:O-antigen/teichoic acid export membrane protein
MSAPADSFSREKIRRFLSAVLNDRMVRDMSWLGIADIAARVSRILATIIAVRSVTAVDLGVAATAITTFELVRVLSRNGVGQFIIRASDTEVGPACATAHRIGWAVSALMAVLQVLAAIAVCSWTGNSEHFWLVASLAAVYVFMPSGLVQVNLMMRRGAISQLSAITAAQAIADSALTCVLALSGFGAWAIVLPKILTAPIWLLGVRYCETWRRKPRSPYVPLAEIMRFSLPLLATEILSALRFNADNLLVGMILGFEAVGIYYFAFNAGLGFSFSVTSALSTALYPQFAKLAHQPAALLERYDSAIRFTAAPIAVLILMQAMAAIFYVPVVFGDKWADQAWLVAILCLSASTKPFFDTTMMLWRSVGRTSDELQVNAILTAIVLMTFAAALTFGLPEGIIAIATSSCLVQAAFFAVANYRISTILETPPSEFNVARSSKVIEANRA